MSEQGETELDKTFAEMKAHILSPAFFEKERDKTMIEQLRVAVKSTNNSVFGKYVYHHGSLLLAKLDKKEIDILTFVNKFYEMLQLGRELQLAYDKAVA